MPCLAMDGALDVILDVVDRAQKSFCDVAMVRIDAGFPSAALLAGLEARDIDYVSRLRSNPVLDRLAEPHMVRPVGRRPATPRTGLRERRDQAESWDKPRRVVLVVKERADDLLLGRFFLAPNLRQKGPRAWQGGRSHGRVEGRAGTGAVFDQPGEVALARQDAEVKDPCSRRLCV